MKRPVLVFAILLLGSVSAFAQHKPSGEPPKQEVQLGRGMSLIAPGLMQVGMETNFFLRLADQLQLADKQRAALEEVAYEYQKYSVQRLADRDVADAELQRLLTRDNIDLDAVRAKVREAEAITTDVKLRMIEAVLKAVTTLTHEQHLKVMILIQELPTPKERPPLGRISE
ncbi:MAG: Spy/CpxP family protein refolding chaperone [Blastocatellales bacterium]